MASLTAATGSEVSFVKLSELIRRHLRLGAQPGRKPSTPKGQLKPLRGQKPELFIRLFEVYALREDFAVVRQRIAQIAGRRAHWTEQMWADALEVLKEGMAPSRIQLAGLLLTSYGPLFDFEPLDTVRLLRRAELMARTAPYRPEDLRLHDNPKILLAVLRTISERVEPSADLLSERRGPLVGSSAVWDLALEQAFRLQKIELPHAT